MRHTGNTGKNACATVVLVGGFLGAGKTTLILTAAERLRAAGRRVGIITNDQGGELVDTRLAKAAGFETGEVTGGCFCCRRSDLVRVGQALPSVDVIFAEPVGSCTDLVATVLRPLRGTFRLSPLTVLVEPGRVDGLEPQLAYLFEKQLAEADLVRFSKADRYTRFPALPGARPLSAHTGEGVGEWLEEVLAGQPGFHDLEIDYRIYAEAEASLGWLNWQADVRCQRTLTPAALVGPLLENLQYLLGEARANIAHLKVFARSAGGYLKASICGNGEEPSIDGALDAPPSLRHELVLNLRASAAPEVLEAALARASRNLPGRVRVRHSECFRPRVAVPKQAL